ncbi:MAG TPA: four helix bundle protein [Burkholderiales bacterium]|nr:four helix bundle protein [Burkholderiales bacterium]
MATITNFEDLEVWRKARELTKLIYAASENGRFGRDLPLRDQVRRAAISIPSNIAEGFERGGRTEFVQFLYIAKGSAGEVRTQLFIALDQRYLTEGEFRTLLEVVVEVSEMLAGLIRYLHRAPLRGTKYKGRADRKAADDLLPQSLDPER